MSAADWVLTSVMLVPIITTILPLIKHDHWIFRIFDFPRLQIAVVSLISIPLNLLFASHIGSVFWVLAITNVICLIYQTTQIIAYTPLTRPQVQIYQGNEDDRTLSVLICNVLTSNKKSHLLLAQIRDHQPDIVLTLESDEWWQSQMDVLEQDGYEHTVKIPLDNLYGMHLYSRLTLEDVEVRHWITEDIPSIKAKVKLRSGEYLHIYCLHPMPPSPPPPQTGMPSCYWWGVRLSLWMSLFWYLAILMMWHGHPHRSYFKRLADCLTRVKGVDFLILFMPNTPYFAGRLITSSTVMTL